MPNSGIFCSCFVVFVVVVVVTGVKQSQLLVLRLCKEIDNRTIYGSIEVKIKPLGNNNFIQQTFSG